MNPTTSVGEGVLPLARRREPQEHAPLGTMSGRHLKACAEVDRQRAALARFVELSRTSRARSDGGRWTRDELHAR